MLLSGDRGAVSDDDKTVVFDRDIFSVWPMLAVLEICKEGRFDVGIGGGASLWVWSPSVCSFWSCSDSDSQLWSFGDDSFTRRLWSDGLVARDAFLVAKSSSNFRARALALLGRMGGGLHLEVDEGGGVDLGGLR